MSKELERIKRLEEELALLKADLSTKKEPIILTQNLKFEVYPEDLPGAHSYNDAKLIIKEELGIDWRLPTRVELLLMYKNREKIGGFAVFSYWSSTESGSDSAWRRNFDDGGQYGTNKGYSYYVRAVRDRVRS